MSKQPPQVQFNFEVDTIENTTDDIIDEIDHITSRDILDVSNEIFLEKNMSTLIYNAREDHD